MKTQKVELTTTEMTTSYFLDDSNTLWRYVTITDNQEITYYITKQRVYGPGWYSGSFLEDADKYARIYAEMRDNQTYSYSTLINKSKLKLDYYDIYYPY